MGMKFLNKKGWHTGSLRNIENVWKAEQKHEAEQKKLEELRVQIQQERERSEFRALQEQAGLVPRQERLEFLYDSGLAVGKGASSSSGGVGVAFKDLEQPAKADNSQQSSVPGALFEDKPYLANDSWRKLHSDPLLQIRQREQEALARLKNNPVKMALIRKSVEEKKPKKKDEDKKERRKKHRKHSKHHSDSEEDTAEEGNRKRSKDHRTSISYDKRYGKLPMDLKDEQGKQGFHRDNCHKKKYRQGSPQTEKDQQRSPVQLPEWRNGKNYGQDSRMGNLDESDVQRNRDEPDGRNRNHDESDGRNSNRGESDGGNRNRYESDGRMRNHDESNGRSRNRNESNGKIRNRHELSGRKKSHGDSGGRTSNLDGSPRNRDELDGRPRNRYELDGRMRNREESDSRIRNREELNSRMRNREESDSRTRSHEVSDHEKYTSKGRISSDSGARHEHESRSRRRNVVPKLTEEERAARLRQMQMDAELHEEQRWKRLKKAEEDDAKEARQNVASVGKNFLDVAQKNVYGAERGGSATIEESVRRRTHYAQRGSEAEAHAFRR